MKLISGELFWSKDGIPFKYEYLDRNVKSDVVIIGGGVSGALCAYYLSSSGHDVLLIEGNIIGYFSTRASTSILQYEVDTNLIGLSNVLGEENAVKVFKMCSNAVYEIGQIIKELDNDCEFNFRKSLLYTDKNKDIKLLTKEYELRKNNGFKVELVDKQRAKDMFSFPMELGILSDEGSGEINPYLFTHYLIRKAFNRGIKVYENTYISKMEFKGHEVILTTSNGFTITTKKVIISAGYEGRKYLPKPYRVKLTRSFTLVTKPIKEFNGWFERCIIRDTEDYYTYFRTTKDNRIMMGGEDIEIGGEHSKMADLKDERVAEEKYKKLFSKLKNMFPEINDIEIEYKFNGIFGITGDGLPYIGELSGMPNCYFCLGYGSNGILYSLIGAKLIRDLISGKEPKELELFGFRRKKIVSNH
jgi:glycine/D-amino acid oxidase-like deaminating enzyme